MITEITSVKTDPADEAAFMRQEYQMTTDYLDRLNDETIKSLERYITLVAAVVGILLSIQQLMKPNSITWEYAAGILAIPLVAGWISYMGNITIDLVRRSTFNHRYSLVRYFISRYPETAEYLRDDTAMTNERTMTYSAIVSWRSIIKRAFKVGGPKVTIVFGNSALAAAIFVVIVTGNGWCSSAFGLLAAPVVFLVFVLFHVAYTRMRFRQNREVFH